MKSTGGLEFLRDRGARRAGIYGDAPDFYGRARPDDPSSVADQSESGPPSRDWDYEIRRGHWLPRKVSRAAPLAEPHLMPERFVDGKDVGRVVAYVVLAPQGFPIPIRLSQIGAVSLRAVAPNGLDVGYRLRCESRRVEKVVSFMADLFPWDEMERFAAALHANGFRLLIARKAGPEDDTRNFAWLNENARYRTREEMFRLERLAMRPCEEGSKVDGTAPVPTLADGRLDDKEEAFARNAPVVGLIKSHANTTYLHPEGWDVLYGLRPGERTPALALETEKLKLVTWYLRLAATAGGGPLDGVVRLEIPRPFFERTVGGDFGYLDALSHFLCELRTRDGTYSRAAVTLQPIQRAEEVLGACFVSQETLISRFYHLTGL